MHLLKTSFENKNYGLGGELQSPRLRVGKTKKLNFHQFYFKKLKRSQYNVPL